MTQKAAQKKILIVDDDRELCQELAEILRLEGYEVDNASSSIAGEELFNTKTYDLGIFDYKMAGSTGAELSKKMKQKNPRCSIIMISGRPLIEKTLKEEGASHLISAVLAKPFVIETLLEKVRSLF